MVFENKERSSNAKLAKGVLTTGEPDQAKSTLGIRDLKDHDPEDGTFNELEQEPIERRDPEESGYNEAGQPVVTQGDLEMEELKESL